jgi:hypothetical protein
VQLSSQHSAPHSASFPAKTNVAELSLPESSTLQHHHQQQQQQQQQQQNRQHKLSFDKENSAIAARELADQKARVSMVRAAELRQLEDLLGATVASSGLKQLDLRQLNVRSWERLLYDVHW